MSSPNQIDASEAFKSLSRNFTISSSVSPSKSLGKRELEQEIPSNIDNSTFKKAKFPPLLPNEVNIENVNSFNQFQSMTLPMKPPSMSIIPQITNINNPQMNPQLIQKSPSNYHQININLMRNNFSPQQQNPIPFAINPANVTVDDIVNSMKNFSEGLNVQNQTPFPEVPRSFPLGTPTPTGNMDFFLSSNKQKEYVEVQPSPSITCTICRGVLTISQKNVLFNGKLYHPKCFVCTTCLQPLENSYYLQREGRPYCEKDFSKLADQAKVPDLPKDVVVTVTAHPANWQIANYNIYPPPAITLSKPLTNNQPIYILLLENTTKSIVHGGFQSGEVRVLRAGHNSIYFTGLKLNKMGPIKNELHWKKSNKMTAEFCLQFKVGTRTLYSDPFKLSSSCSQLPGEVRAAVRPTKVTQTSPGAEVPPSELQQQGVSLTSFPNSQEVVEETSEDQE